MTCDVNDNLEKRIVEAARAMFIARGYADASMSDIAETVGIKRSTLHYYFRTKDRLFQAIFADIVREIFPRIQVILEKDTPFMERLNAVIDEYLSLFRSNPALPFFIVGEMHRDVNHLIGVLHDLEVDGYIRTIKRRFVAEVRRGELRRVPLREFFMNFYSLVIFPTLTRNLIEALMLEEGESYDDFRLVWKRRILTQMGHLLLNTDSHAEVERIVDATLYRAAEITVAKDQPALRADGGKGEILK